MLLLHSVLQLCQVSDSWAIMSDDPELEDLFREFEGDSPPSKENAQTQGESPESHKVAAAAARTKLAKAGGGEEGEVDALEEIDRFLEESTDLRSATVSSALTVSRTSDIREKIHQFTEYHRRSRTNSSAKPSLPSLTVNATTSGTSPSAPKSTEVESKPSVEVASSSSQVRKKVKKKNW